jgi:hypothetical protein
MSRTTPNPPPHPPSNLPARLGAALVAGGVQGDERPVHMVGRVRPRPALGHCTWATVSRWGWMLAAHT